MFTECPLKAKHHSFTVMLGLENIFHLTTPPPIFFKRPKALKQPTLCHTRVRAREAGVRTRLPLCKACSLAIVGPPRERQPGAPRGSLWVHEKSGKGEERSLRTRCSSLPSTPAPTDPQSQEKGASPFRS